MGNSRGQQDYEGPSISMLSGVKGDSVFGRGGVEGLCSAISGPSDRECPVTVCEFSAAWHSLYVYAVPRQAIYTICAGTTQIPFHRSALGFHIRLQVRSSDCSRKVDTEQSTPPESEDLRPTIEHRVSWPSQSA